MNRLKDEMMNIRILGAHSSESRQSKCVSILINDFLAIDAGGLTSSLSLGDQSRLKALLLTHHHFDHIKDIPILSLNLFRQGKCLDIYCTRYVYETIAECLLNDKIYPKFHEIPVRKPTLKFNIIEPGKSLNIEGFDILPLSVNHAECSIGYQVSQNQKHKFFFTGDSGPDLAKCWNLISPDLVAIEVTFPNNLEELASISGHLIPRSFGNELARFKSEKGYLPRILIIHTDPYLEDIIKKEIADIVQNFDAQIEIAYEGMQINVRTLVQSPCPC
jgi:ribonuclease BN (tRNA processing enzyme)